MNKFKERDEDEIDVKIALLLIQFEDANFGEGLTREVQNTTDRVATLLSRFLSV